MDIIELARYYKFTSDLYEGCALVCPACNNKSVHSEWVGGVYYYKTCGVRTISCPECGGAFSEIGGVVFEVS